MKLLRTIIAVLALIALMTPCAHAEEHHHHDLPGAELCAMEHESCHTCSNDSCADTPDAAPVVSVSDVPEPRVTVLFEPQPTHQIFVVIAPPSGALDHLKTVRLLI
jgi:hypothetical protein